MEDKALLRFLILFLGFSYVLSSRLLPDQPGNEDPSVQELAEQGLTEGRNHEEGLEVEETTVRARMDIEIINDDYSPPGANPRHNPPPPRSRARKDIESIEDHTKTSTNDGHHIHNKPPLHHDHNHHPPPGRE